MTPAPAARATGVRAALTLTHVAMGAVLLLPTWAMVSMRSPRLSAQALAAIILLAVFPTWIVALGARVLARPTPGVLRALRWTDAAALVLGLLLAAFGAWMLEMASRSSERGGGLLGALGFVPLIFGGVVAGLATLSLWLVRVLRRAG